jgi:hypothetical protein
MEPDHSLVMATDVGVTRVRMDGTVEELHRAVGEWATLLPRSMARAPDGTLFIGIRHAVVRLTPDVAGKYKEEWLVLPECRTTHVKDLACECLSPKAIEK